MLTNCTQNSKELLYLLFLCTQLCYNFSKNIFCSFGRTTIVFDTDNIHITRAGSIIIIDLLVGIAFPNVSFSHIKSV